MSSINSLGLGSGVLTSDVIDKLKAADTATLITPIDTKITLEKQKGEALKLLSSLLTSFKSSVNSLDDDTLYQKRSVSGGTSNVSVTADAGVGVQSFSITDTLLAQKNVKESGSFNATTSTVATGIGTMSLSVGGISYDIDYTATTSLDDLKESINTIAGDKVKASTLQVGENDYRLILTSIETGADQTITLSDSTGGHLNSKLLAYNVDTNPDGMQEIQASRDASFKYNGITVERSTNEISDIITGVTINLLGESTTAANISISQDVQTISDTMSSFVQSYNTLTSQLTSMTTTDLTAGKVGIFNGDNTINGITREINRLITSVSDNGYSLPQFGIDISESGTMSFNQSTFKNKFNENITASEGFFSGFTTVDENNNEIVTDGVFTTLNTLLERYTKTGGMMSTLTSGSSDELKSLNTNRTRSLELLTTRYETMTARFAQYDALISKLTNQFNTLQQQIDMAVNGTS